MLFLTALVPLLAAPSQTVELTPTEILPHELHVVEIATDARGERFYSIDKTGVVTEWDLEESEALWSTEKHPFGHAQATSPAFHLSVGKDVGARTGPSPVPTFDWFDLDGGPVISGMGSGLGGGDMSDLNATKAVIVDPKDRWVWIGAERGVARLMVRKGSGWSQRGIDNGGTTCLAMDAKARELAIGGKDGTVRFVGNTSCDVVEKDVLEGHEEAVVAIAWHPKGKLIASVSGADKVLVHSRRNQKINRTLEVSGAKFSCLAFHPKGKWLAASTTDGRVYFWDLKKGELLAQVTQLKGRRPIQSLVIWEDGDRLLAASGKGVLSFDTSEVGK